MTALDSRVIGIGSCFAHRFSSPGTLQYSLSPLPSALTTGADRASSYSVTVSADRNDRPPRQYVTVRQANGRLVASPARLEITAGDIVVWSADRTVPFGFRVRGTIGSNVLDSAALVTESIYTHAFGLAGSFEWADANGSDLRGQVTVAMPDAAEGHERWLARIGEGALVHVRGVSAEPADLQIVVGQTVVWAVEDAPGVTITDASLIGIGGSAASAGR